MNQTIPVLEFDCPLCGESIILPRQSPLGVYGGVACEPSGRWPLKFLCTARGLFCEVPSAAIRRGTTPMWSIDQHAGSFWEIECPCSQKNCGRHHAIYTKFSGNATEREVVVAAVRASNAISLMMACSAHHLVVRQDRICARRLKV